MFNQDAPLPNIGDRAPVFSAQTTKGLIQFPEYSQGHWCVFFAHPSNFTSAWMMYSSFLAIKERWFNQRNTKLLALANEPFRESDFHDIVRRRYIGIYLKAPIIEDPDFAIANLYGMAHGRRWLPGFDRLIFIIDPDGIIRLVLNRPLPSIENAITDLERELDRLQCLYVGGQQAAEPQLALLDVDESADLPPADGQNRAAFFPKRKLNFN